MRPSITGKMRASRKRNFPFQKASGPKTGQMSHQAKHAGQAARRVLANAIRALSMDAVQAANSGHPGAPMGMADIAEVLWRDYLKHNPANPRWADRDRFVLSNGHGSMLLYSLLHLTGYEDFRSTSSGTSGNWATRPRATLSTSRVARSRPRPGRWGRASRMPSAWRWQRRCSPPSSIVRA